MALQGESIWRNNEVISFPQWASVLAKEGLEELTKETYRRAIQDFLGFCRTRRAAASIMLAKEYIEQRELQVGRRDEGLRTGLRWFFRQGRKQEPVPLRRGMEENAPKAAEDLGGADWERDLIAAIRRKGFLWRTEQTYRRWAGLFAEHLKPRSPYAATGDDVAAFLSKMAVEVDPVDCTRGSRELVMRFRYD